MSGIHSVHQCPGCGDDVVITRLASGEVIGRRMCAGCRRARRLQRGAEPRGMCATCGSPGASVLVFALRADGSESTRKVAVCTGCAERRADAEAASDAERKGEA